jgi:predicted dehydrogenase
MARPERACIEAGVPFLVEKPLGIAANELRTLAAEVEASGVITCAGFMNRYRKSINRARDLLQEDPAILLDGAWISGPPVRREGDYFANNPIGLWWPIKEKSGGQFVEQVIHTVDLARYLGGEVAEVHAYAANGFNRKLPNIIQNYNLDDAMVVSLKFESGAVGNLMSCCAAGAGAGGFGVFLNVWASQHTARFTTGRTTSRSTRPGKKRPRRSRATSMTSSPRGPRVSGRREDRRSLGIRSTHADGARSTLLALAANESLETGKPVRVQY